MPTLPFALCAYSLPHVLGYLPTKSGEPNPAPIQGADLVRVAAEWDLAGVELPLETRAPSFDGVWVETGGKAADIAALARAQGIRLVADYGALLDREPEHLLGYLRTAADAGAQVVRATLSHVLCGDRRKLAGGWP